MTKLSLIAKYNMSETVNLPPEGAPAAGEEPSAPPAPAAVGAAEVYTGKVNGQADVVELWANGKVRGISRKSGPHNLVLNNIEE